MTALDTIRARLAAARGEVFWRTLEEAADEPAFRELVTREYPVQGPVWLDPIRRRAFLKLMAGALALGGIGACSQQPREPIVPYVRTPMLLAICGFLSGSI